MCKKFAGFFFFYFWGEGEKLGEECSFRSHQYFLYGVVPSVALLFKCIQKLRVPFFTNLQCNPVAYLLNINEQLYILSKAQSSTEDILINWLINLID